MDISQELHTDDFEQILKRRTLRILVVYSPTFYFIDKGQPKGLTYEAMESFVKQLNQKHHTGKLPIKAMYIPVHRDELIPALQAGRGDIAAANLTITPERSKQVAFSKPFADHVHEVLVQGSAAKPITSVQGLSGASVYVRKSSRETLIYSSAALLAGTIAGSPSPESAACKKPFPKPNMPARKS
ncbi:transporter substrate-binding domain-containing protein [Atopomonas hussainii]|nr:transporter substrate-binding domain-containing protein [Atopomonas hussainii]